MAAVSTVLLGTTSFKTAGLKPISQVGAYQQRKQPLVLLRSCHAPDDQFKSLSVSCFIFDLRQRRQNLKLISLSTAAGSGGAYLHSGVVLALERCTFVRNNAGDEGLAILSLGIAENISDVVFDSNAFYCGSGSYGYEMNASEAEVRCRQERHVKGQSRSMFCWGWMSIPEKGNLIRNFTLDIVLKKDSRYFSTSCLP